MDNDPSSAFAALAASYCSEMEAGPPTAVEVLGRLVGLVGAALALPDQSPTKRQYDDPPHLDAACQQVASNVGRMTGTPDLYWEVFDPREEGEPTVGSLTDDLTDIYRDLRRGLHIASVGDVVDAAWEWRFSFQIHWGNHATDAIRVLHRVVTD